MPFDITISVNAGQEAALQKLIDDAVANRKFGEEETPSPAPTPQEYMQRKVDELVDSVRREYLNLRARAINAKILLADNSKIAEVESALGL